MQGLKLVAVAIVAQAVIGMGKKLTNTKSTITY
jgi:chromate transporter